MSTANKILMGAAGGGGGPSDDEFNRVSFLSHFDGANNGVNNAFDDGSTSNHTITANGNVTQGSFGPFARPDGEWGWSFDGSGDSVTTPENAATRIAASNFTFEAFIFPTAGNSNEDTIFTQGADGVYSPFNVFVKSNKITLYISTTGNSWNIADNQSSSNSVAINSWTHVALVRNGATIQLYINGVADNSYSVGTNTFFTPTQVTSVGSRPAGDRPFKGYISNVRLVIGTAIYTSAFTAPTSKLTAVTNTKLLTCQSNRFVDNSSTGFALTPVGNPAVTAFGPFLTSSVYDPAVNGASAYFDGTGDYLDINDGVTFGTGAFTIELFVYVTPAGGGRLFFESRPNTQGVYPAIFIIDDNLYYFVNSENKILGGTFTKNAWNHVAVCRSGTSTKMFVNGSQVGSTYSDSNNYLNGGSMRIGATFTPSSFTPGYFSDVRVVNSAVYTSNFTPPTAPLSAITNTKLLLNMADAQAIDSAAQNNLTLEGQAKLSTAQAKFGDSSFVLRGTNTGDFGKCIIEPFRTGNFTVECFVRINDKSDDQGFFQIADGWVNSAVKGPALEIRSGRWRWFYGNGGNAWHGSAGPAANDTWYHLAFVRNGTTSTFYVDGSSVLTASDSTDYTWGHLAIGVNYDSNYYFGGYIDDFRISRMARYTSNFTAPSAAFADKGQDA